MAFQESLVFRFVWWFVWRSLLRQVARDVPGLRVIDHVGIFRLAAYGEDPLASRFHLASGVGPFPPIEGHQAVLNRMPETINETCINHTHLIALVVRVAFDTASAAEV